MNLLAQIFGGLAIICWITSIQQKDKKKILICQIIANGIYSIQYFLLNAVTAAAMNFTSAFRCLVFYDDEKNKRQTSKYSLFFFCLIILIIGILTYNSILSLIPIIITLAYTYSVWQNNLNITRYVFLIAAFIWIYYNFKVGAYISIFGNLLEIISGVIAIIRFRKN